MTQKKVLIIAFHFPPFAGSSGVQRTLRYVQYLPEYSWEPIVLTANPRVHNSYSDALLGLISNTKVKQAFALDTAQHLSIRGRYLNWMAIPDRWASWIIGAVPAGWLLIKKHKPTVIWSTYPIASAHYIAWFLHVLTGVPWVADFRDPMAEKNIRTGKWSPANKSIRKARLWIEKKAMLKAERVVFCTEGAKKICKERYPEAPHHKWFVISNGYDEETFFEVEKLLAAKPKAPKSAKIILLHSGVLYKSEDRDPTSFFEALVQLKRENVINSTNFEVILRASGYESHYKAIIKEFDIEDIVRLEPPIDYQLALEEMMAVDGLLIFQGYTSNPAIPAKLYEYLRTYLPIFSLVDEGGDTAALMRNVGQNFITPLDDPEIITETMRCFIEKLRGEERAVVDKSVVKQFSRKKLTQKLADVFDKL